MKFPNSNGVTPAQAVDTAKKKRVVVIEDQRMVAEFLMGHCRRLDLEVAAWAATFASGLAVLREHQPDLVLLDISLPDGDGLKLAKLAQDERPEIKILAISARQDSWTMLQVQQLGLNGFVDKTEQRVEVLTEAIQTVLAGHVFYTPVVNEGSATMRRDPKAFIRVLSDYETRILSMIGESKTDDEIGVLLSISPATVQSRRRDIMQKLDIHSTPKLIHYAISHGVTRFEHLVQKKKSADVNVRAKK